jgi:hypothetical protein
MIYGSSDQGVISSTRFSEEQPVLADNSPPTIIPKKESSCNEDFHELKDRDASLHPTFIKDIILAVESDQSKCCREYFDKNISAIFTHKKILGKCRCFDLPINYQTNTKDTILPFYCFNRDKILQAVNSLKKMNWLS